MTETKNYLILLLIILIFLTIIYNKINIKKEKKEKEKQNTDIQTVNNIKEKQYIEMQTMNNEIRDRSVLNDPLVAPERRVAINIPTRGYPDNYQLLGLLTKDNDEKILQLYGRPTFPGSNLWEYYFMTEHNGFVNKVPLSYNKEIYDKDIIYTPFGPFKVLLYNYNTPRYIPFV